MPKGPKKAVKAESDAAENPVERKTVLKRPIWTGSLSFGLINIPIHLYSGSRDRALKFNLLHKEDYAPVGYKKICTVTGDELSENEIVKGYEIEKGQYVLLKDEDFKKADARKTSAIEIRNFADKNSIDLIYYEKPYFIEPDAKSEKAYALFREALKKSGKAGVATFVLRDREKLGVIIAEDDVLVLNQLRFKNEIRAPKDLDIPGDTEIKKEEMEIALLLIDKLSKPFRIEEFKDTFSDALMRIIEDRAAGRAPKSRGKPALPNADKEDLMSLLKRSLSARRSG